MLTSNQIRSDFIKFFQEKGHKFVPSTPVLPIGDETLLFINAGMNQFKDIFLGLTNPGYKRAANSQKCIRAGGKHNDLEEVGVDTYHHTFFEMLGNWSFGDYFKAEAIDWAWELLVDIWKMDPKRLHATYFEGDKAHGIEPDLEAKELWKKYLPDERIHPGNSKDNFWEMGDTGPCGPCSEIHYDDTDDLSGGALVNKDDPNVIEIWNLVFIQFNRDSADKLSPLPARHVDTGMGLERVTRFIQGKKSNYDTDLFMTLMDAIGKVTGQKYGHSETDKKDIAFRVIADHLRTVVFAVTDNCTPSNEGRGYVIRRILRRAARFGRVLGMQEPFIYKLIPTLTDLMGDAFGEIRQRAEFVSTVIQSEEESFGRTLDRGIDIFNTAAEKAKDKTISGEDAFQLYDTYGFPLDLTQLMARERGLKVDTEKFDTLMNIQRQLSRTAQEGDKLKQSLSGVELPITNDNLKYETETCKAVIQGWVSKDGYSTKGILSVTDEPVGLVLDQTCFYAEAGGQVGDYGVINNQKGEFKVEATKKIADCIIHQGKLVSGSFPIGDTVIITVDKARQDTKKNHTATHLLQWALQQVLGDTVHQKGSLVRPEYLRFDFTYPKAPTPEELEQIEKLVCDKIEEALPVTYEIMPIDQAKKLGAMALFGEKYDNEVRVMAIGAEDKSQINSAFSKEFCGGTHVNNTSEIICFKIIKEESVSAGVRRITAETGNYLINGLKKYHTNIVETLSTLLNVQKDEIVHRVKDLIRNNKKLAKELKNASKQSGSDVLSQARELLDEAETVSDAKLVIAKLPSSTIDQARTAIDMVKKKAGSTVAVFGFSAGDKATLIAGVTDDLIKKGIKAGDIIKQIAPIIEGGGGGRSQMAQAGGKNPQKIDEALNKARELIKELL